MKKPMVFLAAVVVAVCATISVNASVPSGCGVSECGGGNDKCCSQDGATYYMTKKN